MKATPSNASQSRQPAETSNVTTTPSLNSSSAKQPSLAGSNDTQTLKLYSSWIHSIHVVTFDIEYGQVLEFSHPKRFSEHSQCLSDKETNNICYSSFPDSNSSILGATQFHFRITTNHQSSAYLTSPILSSCDTDVGTTIDSVGRVFEKYNESVPQSLRTDLDYLYGYVHFLQQKDVKLKRGYFQKSLVILSHLPFVELFKFIVEIIGSEYFEGSQYSYLETFYQRTCYWPPLETNTIIDLNIQGSNVAFFIPDKQYGSKNASHSTSLLNIHPTADKQSILTKIQSKSINSSSSNDKQNNSIFSVSNNIREMKSIYSNNFNLNMGRSLQYNATTDHGSPITLDIPHNHYKCILTAYDLDLYRAFSTVISDLQILWEMTLTCEPFIVIAPTPDICANFVQALTSLIYPFRYSLDYRPFFTIHDQEFKDYVGVKNFRPNAILGVTNPFFTKSLDHWPNIVHLSKIKVSKSTDHLSALTSGYIDLVPNTRQQLPQSRTMKSTLTDKVLFNNSDMKKIGLNTRVKPFLHKDRTFLSKVLRNDKVHVSNRPNNIQTALIRRWLIELTQSFFMPLERFLVQMMPLHSKISPFKAPPELPRFEFETFLHNLESSGQLTTNVKGDWVGLYKKFFESKNFECWYCYRKSNIDKMLLNLHMESFLDADLPRAVVSKAEVEIIDMIIIMKNRLKKNTKLSTKFQQQYEAKLQQLMDTLPADVRCLFPS